MADECARDGAKNDVEVTVHDGVHTKVQGHEPKPGRSAVDEGVPAIEKHRPAPPKTPPNKGRTRGHSTAEGQAIGEIEEVRVTRPPLHRS